MKKSESISTLEETLDLAIKKNRELNTKAEAEAKLRRSLSEDIPQLHIEDIPQTSSNPHKIKSRSRFSTAFRSLRGSSSSKKVTQLSKLDKESVLSFSEHNSLEEQGKELESDKHQLTAKSKKTKLKLGKFALGKIKKDKVAPKRDEALIASSSTQTSGTLQRKQEVDSNLRTFQTRSLDLHSDGEGSIETTRSEKVRKIQITISGKKVERNEKGAPLVIPLNTIDTETAAKSEKRTPISFRKTTSVIDNSREQTKIPITQSIRDTPPSERAPTRPPQKQRLQKQESVTVSPVFNESRRGAIRKNLNPPLRRQKSHEESIDAEVLMRREADLERGRRFPRSTLLQPIIADTQHREPQIKPQSTPKQQSIEQPQPQKSHISQKSISGNNLQNPNLSGSIANYISDDSDQSDTEPNVSFSVGKAARVRQITVINQGTSTKDFSSVESASPKSEGSNTGRRRIQYIDQATLYTDEEREILEGKRKVRNYLSGISEYSYDSDISADIQMPAFGDLTMDPEEAPIMTSANSDKREHLYKILVIGELGTGKTSFIKRYVHQFFSQNYRATIGVDFALKVLHWDQNTIIRLQLWDIAGQERFGNMTRVYYKEAVGAFIVYDVTRSATFDAVIKWKQDLDSKVQLPDGNPIPCILLANKCDQQKQGIVTVPEKMDEYVRENGFAGWYETSAKENINIEEAAKALVNKILLNDKLINTSDLLDSEKFGLAKSGGETILETPKKSCSC